MAGTLMRDRLGVDNWFRRYESIAEIADLLIEFSYSPFFILYLRLTTFPFSPWSLSKKINARVHSKMKLKMKNRGPLQGKSVSLRKNFKIPQNFSSLVYTDLTEMDI